MVPPPGHPDRDKELSHALTRERARRLIDPETLIQDQLHIINIFLRGYEEVASRDPSSPPGTVLEVPLQRERIAELKIAGDMSAKLLNKALPDLQSMSLNDEDKEPKAETMSTTHLLAMVQKMVPALIPALLAAPALPELDSEVDFR